MAYQSMVARAAGYIIKAATDWNVIVNNFAALWVGTTAGDIDYYSNASTKSRIAIGAAGTSLTSIGGVPSWVAFYPVGAIYMSTISTNPATLLGFGTWTAFAAGRVLVGFDAGQTEFDTVEKTGGAKTHALTEAELAPHVHTYLRATGTQLVDGGAQSARHTGETTTNTSSTGSGTAHNNLQPYIVVYAWKRTA